MSDVNFVVGPYSLEECARSGYFSIPIKVRGFWSCDSIRVYGQYRGSLISNDQPGWEFNINWGSGGRSKEIPDDAEAMRYFAEAMNAAADLVDFLRSQERMLTFFHADERARQKAEREAEILAKQAEREADTPLGEEKAEEMMNNLISSSEASYIRMFMRGTTYTRSVKTGLSRDAGKRIVRINDVRVARSEALKKLAESSHRTQLIVM